MISPPCSPAIGPISTIRSATCIISVSCSTTITVLPLSRSARRISMSRELSRGCRPMVGSSSTYKAPTRAEPREVAMLMRWDSPPERVCERRSSVKIPESDIIEDSQAFPDFLEDAVGHFHFEIRQPHPFEEGLQSIDVADARARRDVCHRQARRARRVADVLPSQAAQVV
jgi:hypothetical protein